MPEKELPIDLINSVTGAAQRAAQRSTSMNNLKQLALAMHNHHDTYLAFPTSALNRQAEKQPPHKYPLVGEWPSCHLSSRRSYITATSSMSHGMGRTTASCSRKCRPSFDIPMLPQIRPTHVTLPWLARLPCFDLTNSRAYETSPMDHPTRLCWSKLRLRFPGPSPKTCLLTQSTATNAGGFSEEGYNIVLGDGAVKFLGKTIDEGLLRKMITMAGGEVLQ